MNRLDETALAPAHGFFLPATRGRLFCLYHVPLDQLSDGHDVILVPPLAEEMNKSRRMFSLVSRALRQEQSGALLIDLYGTGDSEGDFADARWEIWKEDLVMAYRWLRSRSERPISLLGLRLGGLLAMDFACSIPLPIESIVLWQPVVSGQAHVTQFLRTRLAASMTGSADEKESTQSLRERLRAGEFLEVAGYELAPDLVAAIDSLSLQSLPIGKGIPIHWMEVSSTAGQPLAPASERVIVAWREQKLNVISSVVRGTPFWSTQEITAASDLVATTAAIFSRRDR